MTIIRLVRNVFGGINFIIQSLFYIGKLSFSLPSLSFGCHPFKIYKSGFLSIGSWAILGKQTELIVKGKLSIGHHFTLNKYSRIVAHANINIGNRVTIAQFVSILDHDHAYKVVDDQMILDGYLVKDISIGNNVWIADKVTICKGVTIGNNVIIGANSVVIKDIEDNCIAVGNPCKKIKGL